MKLVKNFLRTFVFAAVLGSAVTFATSCKEDDPADEAKGKISGVVKDEAGAPIQGVAVTVSGETATATTAADGTYTVENVSIAQHSVTFNKSGYMENSVTVAKNKFVNGVATANATLTAAAAKITGKVLDGKNDNAPLSGVTVSVSASLSATSAADGTFTIENVVADDYMLTYTKAGFDNMTYDVVKADFVGGEANVPDMVMGAKDLLPTLTINDLVKAPTLMYNEYVGGGNWISQHGDWSCGNLYASVLHYGNIENQSEGVALQPRSNTVAPFYPVDLDNFDSYIYFKKAITANNKTMTLTVRTHQNPAVWGVQVVDLAAATAAVKIGNNLTYASDNYATFDFDLSAYTGKEIVVAIGLYRAGVSTDSEHYWKQLPIGRIAFAPAKVNLGDWMPGTEVAGLAGWHMTQEMVAQTPVQTKSTFTGITPDAAEGEGNSNTERFRRWRSINHVGKEWMLMSISKDIEPFPGEGYLIKTSNAATTDLATPQNYIYAKFAITAANKTLTLKTRNFSGSKYTFFKLSVIKEDYTVAHLTPVYAPGEGIAANASAVAGNEGMWKFINNDGGVMNPEKYATFTYDLSSYVGSNVMILLSNFRGETGGEFKLVINSITLN